MKTIYQNHSHVSFPYCLEGMRKCRSDIRQIIILQISWRLYMSCFCQQLYQTTSNLRYELANVRTLATYAANIRFLYFRRNFATKHIHTFALISAVHGFVQSCDCKIFLTADNFCFFINSLTFFLNLSCSFIGVPFSPSPLSSSSSPFFFLVLFRNVRILIYQITTKKRYTIRIPEFQNTIEERSILDK